MTIRISLILIALMVSACSKEARQKLGAGLQGFGNGVNGQASYVTLEQERLKQIQLQNQQMEQERRIRALEEEMRRQKLEQERQRINKLFPMN